MKTSKLWNVGASAKILNKINSTPWYFSKLLNPVNHDWRCRRLRRHTDRGHVFLRMFWATENLNQKNILNQTKLDRRDNNPSADKILVNFGILLNYVNDVSGSLKRVVTGDESSVYGYDVEVKVRSSDWKSSEEQRLTTKSLTLKAKIFTIKKWAYFQLLE